MSQERATTVSTTRGRVTRQGIAVRGVLEGLEEFRSAQDIHDLLRHRDEKVGLTTVYRVLASLVEAGEVDTLRTEGGEAVYRACSTHHHHHLVCRSCGVTVEVEGPAVERWADRTAAEHGFADVSHHVEIFGSCGDCTRGG